MNKINPFLWFNDHAEEAMSFYVSVFKDSRVINVTRYGEVGPMPKGTVMVATFEIEGQVFHALNGGPQYFFSPAISFLVNCETQEEVDELWEQLSEKGEQKKCGWLQDQFGVSWQIIPRTLGELMNDPDPEKAERVTAAMMEMTKIDIEKLKRAYEGK